MDLRVATPSQTKAVGLRPVGRRGHYRHQIQTLAYVNLDQANGGVIRNLGDAGMAIQAVTPLYVNQQVVLRFDLPNPRVRLEAKGRVAWADPVGQAGIEFLALSQRSRRLLKEWIFVQLMASAEHPPEMRPTFMARVDKRLRNWRSPRMRGQLSVWELE